MPITPLFTVYVAMALFPLAVMFLFQRLPPLRACFIGFLLGACFLPEYSITLIGLPEISKRLVTGVGVLLAVIVCDKQSLLRYRFHPIDLALLAYLAVVFISPVINDLGVYRACSNLFIHLTQFGIPFFLGRVYIQKEEDALQVAKDLALVGLIYCPLYLWEVRMSPQLHTQLYGYFPHSFAQQMRDGGFRAVLFMGHGIITANFMMITALSALLLWKKSPITHIGTIPVQFVFFLLLICVLLSKTVGTYALLAIGITGIYLGLKLGARLALTALALSIPCYILFRILTPWNGEGLVALVSEMASSQRAHSLMTRITNENAFKNVIALRHWFGWGSTEWRGYWSTSDNGIVDSIWILYYGVRGFFGLITYLSVTLLPALLTTRYFTKSHFNNGASAGVRVLSIVVVLHGINNLFNADLTPFFAVISGGLANFVWAPASSLAASPVEADVPLEAIPHSPRLV